MGPGGPPLPPSGPAIAYPGSSNNSNAVASLVCGILGLATVCLCPVVSPILGITAIALGSRARRVIRSSGGTDGGDGMATGGVITGWIALVLSALLFAAIVAVLLLGIATSRQRVIFNTMCVGSGC